jgi:hypothetical protein
MALACLYKTLDIDPTFEKARERFNKCLDSWIASGGRSTDDQREEEREDLGAGEDDVEGFGEEAKDGEGDPDEDGEWEDEEVIAVKEGEEEQDEEATRLAEDLKQKKERAGTFLDDDLFSEEGEGRRKRSQAAEPDEGHEEGEEPWDDDGEEDEDMPPVKKTIKCKCGSDIPIYSDERPYRFKCFSCNRTGTLKA